MEGGNPFWPNHPELSTQSYSLHVSQQSRGADMITDLWALNKNMVHEGMPLVVYLVYNNYMASELLFMVRIWEKVGSHNMCKWIYHTCVTTRDRYVSSHMGRGPQCWAIQSFSYPKNSTLVERIHRGNVLQNRNNETLCHMEIIEYCNPLNKIKIIGIYVLLAHPNNSYDASLPWHVWGTQNGHISPTNDTWHVILRFRVAC